MALYIIIPTLIIAIHLLAIKKEWGILKSVSKVFLMPSIFLAFFVISEYFHLKIPHRERLIAVMIFYTLGDALLELPNGLFFIAGGLSFSIGHVIYSSYFLADGYSILWGCAYLVLWAIIYIILIEPQLSYTRPNSTKFMLYVTFVIMLGLSVGASKFGNHWMAKALSTVGTLSYVFSDVLVIIRQCKDKTKEEMVEDDLLIMVTYIGANILLLSGIMLSHLL